MTDHALAERARFAGALARKAGALARRYFTGDLRYTAESKGLQDLVSEADREVEALIRCALAEQYPADAVLGEEGGGNVGERTWVIDPIDGTHNFVHGMRYWCVSIACVAGTAREVAAICDPSLDELFVAARGLGATCNDDPIRVSTCDALDRALVANGYVHRHPLDLHIATRRALLAAGAVVKDMGAGALMLAHLAAGRLDGFVEPHMHPWDALAGLLLIEEAGGRVLPYPGGQGLAHGGRVIAAAPALYPVLERLVDAA
jgi:myo-inositol-1(or 4)-monophosphatase